MGTRHFFKCKNCGEGLCSSWDENEDTGHITCPKCKAQYYLDIILIEKPIFPQLKIRHDTDQDILLFCAFRYALGRQTYVVGSIAGIIYDNWGILSKERRKWFKQEIRDAVHNGLAGSDVIDVPEWKRILELPDE